MELTMSTCRGGSLYNRSIDITVTTTPVEIPFKWKSFTNSFRIIKL